MLGKWSEFIALITKALLFILDLTHWFVTSNTTQHTYRNIYCALCNGESVHRLLFWELELDCPQPLLMPIQQLIPTPPPSQPLPAQPLPPLQPTEPQTLSSSPQPPLSSSSVSPEIVAEQQLDYYDRLVGNTKSKVFWIDMSMRSSRKENIMGDEVWL